MREAARARGHHAKTIVPRLANNCRGTPTWFREGASNTRAGSMKVKQLNIDTGPIVSRATAACLGNQANQALPWNWQYVRKIKSLYRVKSHHLEGK